MDVDAIRKELEKYDSMREKVLRLNELGKYDVITYGLDYISIKNINRLKFVANTKNNWKGECLICKGFFPNICFVKSNIGNYNNIEYYLCNNCCNFGNKLCATCLRPPIECYTIKKQKITFWLCATKFIIPKDIRRIITNLI
jgi:hypothetical protein